MKSNYLFILLLAATMSTTVFNIHAKVEPIKGASYYIENSPTEVTFYNADGDIVKQATNQEYNFRKLNKLIDTSAPRPKAVRAELVYNEGTRKSFSLARKFNGYSLIYYDKNNNKIKGFGYNECDNTVITSTGRVSLDKLDGPSDLSLDLSQCGAPIITKARQKRWLFSGSTITAGFLLLGYGLYSLYKELKTV